MDPRLSFSFAGHDWMALPSGALFWPAHRILLVADLHLEKASFFAALGQPLPPYDSRATLARLADCVVQCDPDAIWCLGDSFHDPDGQHRLEPAAADLLRSMAQRRRWHFIAGNHDGLTDGLWGTEAVEECELDGIVFRHIHDPDDSRPQVSGHFHPRLQMIVRGRSMRRPCFVHGEKSIILPAFGSLTGGLDIDDPAIAGLFPKGFDALVATGRGLARFRRGPVAKMSHQPEKRARILG